MNEADILAELLDEVRLNLHAGPVDLRADAGVVAGRFPLPVYTLLEHDGDTFVRQAYQQLLGRSPDERELAHFGIPLASARWNKIEILGQIRYSPEGNAMGRNVLGLRKRFTLQRLYHLPVVGRVLRIGTAVLLLPRAIRDLQRVEQAAHADRLRLEALEVSAASAGPGLAVRVVQLEARLADMERLERRLRELERKAVQH